MRLEDVIDPAKRRVRLVPGFATDTQDTVTVGGLDVPAFWMAHVFVQQYDPIWVLMADNPDSFSTAVVIGANGSPSSSVFQPLYGTVSAAPIGADVVTVSTETGPVDAAFGADYTPQVSDKVRLLWQDDNAWVLGKSAKVPNPKIVPPKTGKPLLPSPPGSRGSGSETFTASDSATYATGTSGWNSRMGKDVYQGSWPGVGNARGAWFYHGKPKKLKGRKSTKVEVWVPRRLNAGSHNSAVDMQIYLHSSARRPKGDVNRGAGIGIRIPANFRGGWKTLPKSWGDALISGDGLGLAGGSYAGFTGVKSKSKNSGQIRITWEV